MDLKSLMIDSKAVWVDFPGHKGFSVEIANLSKQELSKLRKSCTYQKFDRKSRVVIDSVDEDKFVERFAAKTVKNWKGLTLAILETLILVDVTDKDLTEELTFSPENAGHLVANSSEFDTWLNDTVFDLENFRS